MNFQLGINGIVVTVFMKVANTLQDILSDIHRVLEVLHGVLTRLMSDFFLYLYVEIMHNPRP